MAVELRCDNKILFGVLGDRVLEVKCRSARCGAKRGTVIIHRFSATTGSLLETLRFSDPAYAREEGVKRATDDYPAAVRSA